MLGSVFRGWGRGFDLALPLLRKKGAVGRVRRTTSTPFRRWKASFPISLWRDTP